METTDLKIPANLSFADALDQLNKIVERGRGDGSRSLGRTEGEQLIADAEFIRHRNNAKEKDALTKWVALLRSGKYGQTEGNLYVSEDSADDAGRVITPGFCCLGVYCAGILDIPLTQLDGVSMPSELFESPHYSPHDDGYLVISESAQNALANLNDWDYSFADIANLVEGLYLNA